jgi:hypothetical protein
MTLHQAFDEILTFFHNDMKKTLIWFYTANPMLGGISPAEMIMLGREEKLIKAIKSAMEGNRP